MSSTVRASERPPTGTFRGSWEWLVGASPWTLPAGIIPFVWLQDHLRSGTAAFILLGTAWLVLVMVPYVARTRRAYLSAREEARLRG